MTLLNCIWCGKPAVLRPGHLSCNPVARGDEEITITIAPQRSSLEVLRAKIVEAVPEKGNWRCPRSNCGRRSNTGGYCGYLGCEGFKKRADKAQEIALADVLLAVGQTEDGYMAVDQDFNILTKEKGDRWHFAESASRVGILAWDPLKSFENQPQPVIDFLATILV